MIVGLRVRGRFVGLFGRDDFAPLRVDTIEPVNEKN